MTSPQQQQNLQNQNYVAESSQQRSNKVSFSPNDIENRSPNSWQPMPQDETIRYNLLYSGKPNESFQQQSLGIPQQDFTPNYIVNANNNMNIPLHAQEPYFLEGSNRNQVIQPPNVSLSSQETSQNLLPSKEQFQNEAFNDGMNHTLNRVEFNQEVGVGNLNNFKVTNEQRSKDNGKSPLNLSISKETYQQRTSPSLPYMSQNPMKFQSQDTIIGTNVAPKNDQLSKFGKPIFLKCFLQGIDNTQQSFQDIDASQYNFQNDVLKNFHPSSRSTSTYLGSSSSQETKYSVVLSNLRWIQKLIIIPSKGGGCHDITSTVMIIVINFLVIY